MAKHTKTVRHHSRALVRVPTIKPIVIRSTKIVKAAKRHGRRVGGKLIAGVDVKKIIGGGALGFIKKNFPNIPHLPGIGQNGTVAAIAYVLRGKVPYAEDVMNAAVVIASYQFMATGTVEGGDYVAGQF
jgi:hypothetical protein